MMMPPSMKLGLSVTLAGTVAMFGSLVDNCATGLALSVAFLGGRDTKPESALPPIVLGVLSESESPDAADGCTVSRTLWKDVPAFAVMSEHPAEPLTVCTANVALEPDIPFDVVTVAGTVATDGVLLVTLTKATQLLHNPLTTTVPVELLPAVTEAGESLNEPTSAEWNPTTTAIGAATTNRRRIACTHLLVWPRLLPMLLNMDPSSARWTYAPAPMVAAPHREERNEPRIILAHEKDRSPRSFLGT